MCEVYVGLDGTDRTVWWVFGTLDLCCVPHKETRKNMAGQIHRNRERGNRRMEVRVMCVSRAFVLLICTSNKEGCEGCLRQINSKAKREKRE